MSNAALAVMDLVENGGVTLGVSDDTRQIVLRGPTDVIRTAKPVVALYKQELFELLCQRREAVAAAERIAKRKS